MRSKRKSPSSSMTSKDSNSMMFFKVYLPDQSSHQLKLPSAFVKRLSSKIPPRSLVCSRNRTWPINVEKINNALHFENGWSNFVRDNSLEPRDFLVFSYVDKRFNVKIYGKNGCEKTSSYVGKEIKIEIEDDEAMPHHQYEQINEHEQVTNDSSDEELSSGYGTDNFPGQKLSSGEGTNNLSGKEKLISGEGTNNMSDEEFTCFNFQKNNMSNVEELSSGEDPNNLSNEELSFREGPKNLSNGELSSGEGTNNLSCEEKSSSGEGTNNLSCEKLSSGEGTNKLSNEELSFGEGTSDLSGEEKLSSVEDKNNLSGEEKLSSGEDKNNLSGEEKLSSGEGTNKKLISCTNNLSDEEEFSSGGGMDNLSDEDELYSGESTDHLSDEDELYTGEGTDDFSEEEELSSGESELSWESEKRKRRKKKDNRVKKRPRASTKQKERDPNAAANKVRTKKSSSEYPYFKIGVLPVYIYHGSLNIPMPFAQKYLKVGKVETNLKVLNKSWPVTLTTYRNGCCKISSGWLAFVRDNYIEEGDICLFELIDTSAYTFRVSISSCSS